MSPTRFALALGLASGLLALLPSAPARACSCMEQGPEPAIEQADAVFEGRVVGVSAEPAGGVGPGTNRVVLRVVRAWKGVERDQEQLEVRTASNSAACGYNFEPDRSYLVYAREGRDGGLHVSLCSRTQLIEEADADLEVLGAGVTPVDVEQEPAEEVAPPPQSSESAGCASCHVGGGRSAGDAALLALVALWMLRRRRAARQACCL